MPLRYCRIAFKPLMPDTVSLAHFLSHSHSHCPLSLALALSPSLSICLSPSFLSLSLSLSREQVKQKPWAHFNPKPKLVPNSAAPSVGNPLCPYGSAFRRGSGFFLDGLIPTCRYRYPRAATPASAPPTAALAGRSPPFRSPPRAGQWSPQLEGPGRGAHQGGGGLPELVGARKGRGRAFSVLGGTAGIRGGGQERGGQGAVGIFFGGRA